MNTILLPDGTQYDATYAGEDAAQTVFSASLITTDIIGVVNAFSNTDHFTVINAHTGEKVYSGYTVLSELHKIADSITIILRKEG